MIYWSSNAALPSRVLNVLVLSVPACSCVVSVVLKGELVRLQLILLQVSREHRSMAQCSTFNLELRLLR